MADNFFLHRTNTAPHNQLDNLIGESLKALGKAMMAAVLFLLTHAELVQAATYYVATTGGDANTGTQSAPFRTVKKGISVLSPGDTLYIRGGNYGESINSNNQTLPAGTSWSSVVTISAYPSESVTITNVLLSNSQIRYLVFQDLTIDAQSSVDETVYINGANHIRFRNCEIKNARRQGVLMPHPGADYNEFINCNVHHNGTTQNLDHGFYVASSNNTVEGCLIHDNAAFGLQIYNGYGERADNNTIKNNKVFNNSTAGTGSGLLASSGSGNLIYNNIVYGHQLYGIDVSFGSPSNTGVYNNTVYNNGGGIRAGSDSTGAIIKNNIVYQSGSAVSNSGSGTTLSNNLTADPKFVNPSAGDFQLQSTSPAIDSGVALPQVGIDIEGVLRPQGTAFDLGAHEYKSQQAATPTPPTNLVIVAP